MSPKTTKIVAAVIMIAASAAAAGIANSPRTSRQALPQPDAKPSGPGFYDPADAYDPAAIAANPVAYYGRSVPSRVWQSAPLAAGEAPHEELAILSPRFRFVQANARSAVPLAVRVKPRRSVTFTALDQGTFANGKISITVQAGQDGYAKVDFWVGGAGDFRVLAGSPENKGPAEFTMQALPRDQFDALESGQHAKQYRAAISRGRDGK